MPAAPTTRRHRRLYQIGTGTRFAMQLERCTSGFIALHQGDNMVLMRQQDLYQAASALADWANVSERVPE